MVLHPIFCLYSFQVLNSNVVSPYDDSIGIFIAKSTKNIDFIKKGIIALIKVDIHKLMSAHFVPVKLPASKNFKQNKKIDDNLKK